MVNNLKTPDETFNNPGVAGGPQIRRTFRSVLWHSPNTNHYRRCKNANQHSYNHNNNNNNNNNNDNDDNNHNGENIPHPPLELIQQLQSLISAAATNKPSDIAPTTVVSEVSVHILLYF